MYVCTWLMISCLNGGREGSKRHLKSLYLKFGVCRSVFRSIAANPRVTTESWDLSLDANPGLHLLYLFPKTSMIFSIFCASPDTRTNCIKDLRDLSILWPEKLNSSMKWKRTFMLKGLWRLPRYSPTFSLERPKGDKLIEFMQSGFLSGGKEDMFL